jgi:glucose/arabinose dehydrogenase
MFGMTSSLLFAMAIAALTPQIQLRQIAHVTAPTSIASAGDLRLFITQQTGQIVIYDGTGVSAVPFLDLSSLVSCCGERGLLSVAFHPRYRDNGLFFVDYTDTNGDTIVARYRVSAADPDRADPASALRILKITQPFNNHNGGQLQFGSDGYLYIGMGDGGSGGDPQNNAQNRSSLLGKILRIDIDGASPYAVPASNPFVATAGARAEIWALGLRNPWRFSFDRANGDLWIADVGQDSWEEIDLQRVTSTGGENYGWRVTEGTHCYNPSTNCATGGITFPIVEYSHAGGACSITGGYRYRGSRYPYLSDVYLYADYCSGQISGLTEDANGTFSSQSLLKTTLHFTTFGQDANGELYIATESGNVYAIMETQGIPARRRAAAH